MLLLNEHADPREPHEVADAEVLGVDATKTVSFPAHRKTHKSTPLGSLPELSKQLGVASISLRDEGLRLGLGSFKTLGGSYAVVRLVLEDASKPLGRDVDVAELQNEDVREIASRMTVACAIDGNHGRSVAIRRQMLDLRAFGASEECITGFAMQGYAALLTEALRQMPEPPTHVVVQAGVWLHAKLERLGASTCPP